MKIITNLVLCEKYAMISATNYLGALDTLWVNVSKVTEDMLWDELHGKQFKHIRIQQEALKYLVDENKDYFGALVQKLTEDGYIKVSKASAEWLRGYCHE